MGAVLDFVVERTTPDDAVDITAAISVLTDGLAAIAGDQLIGVETKTVVSVPALAAIAAVFICEQVIPVSWATSTIVPTF